MSEVPEKVDKENRNGNHSNGKAEVPKSGAKSKAGQTLKPTKELGKPTSFCDGNAPAVPVLRKKISLRKRILSSFCFCFGCGGSRGNGSSSSEGSVESPKAEDARKDVFATNNAQ